MPSENLTDERCRKAHVVAGKVTEYLDTRQRGLALRISPPSAKNPGGAKSWTIRYRTSAGDQRRVSLGSYPAVSLSRARDKALAVLASVAEGKDPAAEKKAARSTAKSIKLDTVKAIGERYLAEAEKGRHRANGRAKRASTISLERYYFNRRVEPEYGKRILGDLSRAELQVFINRMADEYSPSTARQCRVVLQRLYAFAEWQEITDVNPVRHVHAPGYGARDRVLSDAEVRTIWDATALPVSTDFYMSSGMATAIRLLAVTLQRRTEVTGMHTREIDRAARTWTIPGDRTKNHFTHVVPLSALALELIDQAIAVAERDDGYLFPSPRDRTRPVRKDALTLAFARLAEVRLLQDARPHDLRRTGSTNLTGERIGIPRFIVSRVLNQISDTGGAAMVTRVYDRNDYLPEKRRALDAWAALLTEIASHERHPSRL